MSPSYAELLALEARIQERLYQNRKTARLVTVEEHCETPFPVPSTSATWNQFSPEYIGGVKERLGDVKKRVQIMDLNNIEAQIISHNQPGAHGFTNAEDCTAYCRKVNQFIYEPEVSQEILRFRRFTLAGWQIIPVSDDTWRDFGYRNAIRLFKLPLDMQ